MLDHLTDDQPCVIAADQPVYALGKQVQWMYPDQFGDTVWLLGSLHTEMCFLALIGDWLEDSGWENIFVESGIAKSGFAHSFLSGKFPKRTRHAHHITIAT